MAKKTFDTMAQEFQLEINRAVYILTTARCHAEVEDANKMCHKLITKYSKDMKQFIDNLNMQVVTDHSKMQKLLNDRFNLDPEKAELTFCISRHTVKWTVRLMNGEFFTYITKWDEGVDLENFAEFCRCMFS